MNPTDNMTNLSADDRRFDRLVDGELSEADRRELLSRLDHEPDGWRHCALAFLESQCWRTELKAIAARPVERPASSSPRRPLGAWPRYLTMALAMAATFMIAMLAGSQLREMGIIGGGPQNQIVKKEAQRSAPAGSAQRPQPSDRWEMVTLTAGGPGGATETIRVPAVERPTIDQQWLNNLPGAVPPEVLQAFERSGHQVSQHRELVPLEMQDGRRLVVPVDKVQVHYVGRKSL